MHEQFVCQSVCLFVRHTLLAPYALHGRRPQPRRSIHWALQVHGHGQTHLHNLCRFKLDI